MRGAMGEHGAYTVPLLGLGLRGPNRGHGREMWLIIGAMALITPIGLIAFRRFLQTDQVRSS